MKHLYVFIFCAWYVTECSALNANIFRNSTYRRAVFVKRLEDQKLAVKPNITKDGLTYHECSRLCLRVKVCKSFNLQLVEPYTCEILNKMVFDSAVHEYYKENWNNYDPGPVLLPCLARLYKMPESLNLNHSVYSTRLTDENVDQRCDMQTDGGK